MDFIAILKGRRWHLAALLVIFMAVAFLVRAIPAFSIGDTGFLHISDTDSWYNLRQIEVMVHQFPQYNWFDPMTAFPQGKTIDWGPLYPVIAAALCLVTGSATHNGVVFMSGWVGPLMGVAMVPVAYCLGKAIRDEVTGVVAAGLISVVSYQYFFLSSYGLVDHHIAEVLFTSLFILCYLASLNRFSMEPAKKWARANLVPASLAVLAGVFWFFSLVTSTTVLIILVVAAIFTLAKSVVDVFEGKSSRSLLVVNLIVALISAALLLASGILRESGSVAQYSYGTLYILLAFAGGSLVLFATAEICQGRKNLYLISIAGMTAIGIALTRIIPSLSVLSDQALTLLSGAEFTLSVQETLPWSLSDAFTSFNVGLILAAAGFAVLCIRFLQKREDGAVFLAIWSVLLLAITVGHQRFEYYLTVPVIILISICITDNVPWLPGLFTGWTGALVPDPGNEGNETRGKTVAPDDHNDPTKAKEKRKGKDRIKITPKSTGSGVSILNKPVTTLIVILTIFLIGHAIFQDYTYGASIRGTGTITPDWSESLDWLASQTPSTGIDYFGQYDPVGYSYPGDAYGIMAVWDAGHWITFFSHRIPITNPFQDNLGGTNGAAAFFLSTNESGANGILHTLGGRYVVTDSGMAVDTFTGLVPWADPSADITPYIKWFLAPEPGNPGTLQKVHKFDDAYFQTMVARLNNFDGSLQDPGQAEYIRYAIRQVPAPGEKAGDVNGYARVIESESRLNVSGGINGTEIIPEGKILAPSHYANIFSSLPNQTVAPVPALMHYRLVHESPDDSVVIPFPESAKITLPGIRQVKVYEYVEGAHIAGNGIIEVPVVTNTGRNFTYRQQSSNGEFIVPYSTTGNLYNVKTTGKYHIIGTDRYFAVTEEEVTGGAVVPVTHIPN